MLKISKRFNFAFSILIMSTLALTAAVYVNIHKYYLDIYESADKITVSKISNILSKFLVSIISEKYSSELVINADRHNIALKKIANINKEKRIKSFSELTNLVNELKDSKYMLLMKNDVTSLEKKISNIFQKSDELLLNLSTNFKISDWSNLLNSAIDDVEKLAESLTMTLDHNQSIVLNFAKLIADCYRQVFVLSMYARESTAIDELGQVLIFSYERNIKMYWKKIETVLELTKGKYEFLNEFKRHYFDSFVNFRNNFINNKELEFSSLFTRFNSIVLDFDKFSNVLLESSISGFSPKSFPLNNLFLLGLLALHFLGIYLYAKAKKEKESLVMSGVTIGEYELGEPEMSIRKIDSIINPKKEFMAILIEKVRYKAIENHCELNKSYEFISRNINKFKEKINTIIYKNHKFQEILTSGLSRLDDKNFKNDIELAENLLNALQQINASSGVEQVSYKEIEDMASEVETSSYKVEIVKNVSTEILDKIESLSARFANCKSEEIEDGLTEQMDKLSMMASAKSNSIKQYVEEIKRTNTAVISILRSINNFISIVKNTTQKALGDKEQEINLGSFAKYKDGLGTIQKTLNEHITSSKGVLDSLCENIVVSKESVIKLINSMSIFKENILEDLQLVHDGENTVLEDNVSKEDSLKKNVKLNTIEARILSNNRQNKFLGNATSISMNGAVVNLCDACECANFADNEVEIEFDDIKTPIKCDVTKVENDKVILEFKTLSNEQRNYLKLLI